MGMIFPLSAYLIYFINFTVLAADNSPRRLIMPITITLTPNNVDGSGSNLFYAIGTLTFSGNYSTGGDTLDFTTVVDKLPSTQIIQVFADSQNGNGGYYLPVAGSPLKHWKAQPLNGRRPRIAPG